MPRISDSLNFLSKLRVHKLSNAFQIISSYYLSKWTGRPIHWGMPMSISFEPTTHCNLRCPECPSGLRSFKRQTGSLNKDLFTNTIDAVSQKLCYLLFYFQGEPYLNPSFLEMVSYASAKKIYTATSTNAHYLDNEAAKKTVESGLDRLIISIDGTTQETYEAYRKGGSLEKVLNGTRQVIKWKKQLKSSTPYVIFQFLAVKPNQHQIKEVHALGKEYGVDEVKIKTAQIYDYENGSPLIPTIAKYSRYYLNENGKYHLKNNLSNHCWKLWHSTVITWDGMLVPCCFDKDAKHPMGSLNNTTFEEIWNGEKYRQFRSALIGARNNIDICTNCSEGTKVWSN